MSPRLFNAIRHILADTLSLSVIYNRLLKIHVKIQYWIFAEDITDICMTPPGKSPKGEQKHLSAASSIINALSLSA